MSEAPRRRRRRSDNSDDAQRASPLLADRRTYPDVAQNSFPEQGIYDEYQVAHQKSFHQQRRYDKLPDVHERKMVIRNEEFEQYGYDQQRNRNPSPHKRAEHIVNYEDSATGEINYKYYEIKNRNKGNQQPVLLLISAIIGTLYVYFLSESFLRIDSNPVSISEALGNGIAAALVMPHIASTFMAVLFNWLGYFLKSRGFALTGAILYSVAAVVFFIYAMFVVPEIVLSFVGYANMKKNRA